jgi:GT2 family glycosyltransferase
MRATVIIPCLNAQETLGSQLEALAAQPGAGELEVLVVDNGSTDGSRQVAWEFRDRFRRFLVVEAGDVPGASHARNVGARLAEGQLLLFCDADDVVGEGWLPAMVDALRPEEGLVASRIDHETLNPGHRVAGRGIQTAGLQTYGYPPFLPHAATCGLGVHASVHRAIGGFDEGIHFVEDTDYCWRAQLAGYSLRFVPDAVVHMRSRPDLVSEWRQRANWGMANVGLYARYRDQGMPRIRFGSTLRAWIKLLRGSPRLLSKDRRQRWLGQVAFRLGRIRGCIRYRVFAP